MSTTPCLVFRAATHWYAHRDEKLEGKRAVERGKEERKIEREQASGQD